MHENDNRRRGASKKKRSRVKPVVFTVIILLLVPAFILMALRIFKPDALSPAAGPESLPAAGAASGVLSAPEPAPPQPQELRASFSHVGDNLVHNGIYMQANARAGGDGYDFSYAFENVKYFFEQFDVNWMNQETLVNDELPPSTYPMFSTPGEMGHATYDAGWRVYSLSNNHSYDKGAAGIAATRRYWAAMPDDVLTAGLYTDDADDGAIVLQEVNGMTVAYLSYTEHTNGLPTPADAEAHIIYTSDTATMERQIRRAAELADAVIVGVHWGVEGSHTVTEAQRALATDFATWGATAVIGTHPHVIQPIEWVESAEDGRQVPVVYSLGNFLSAQANAPNLVGLCFTYELAQTVEPDGTRQPVRVENIRAYPTVTHYDANYNNIRDYMFRDYTDELAARHGVHERYGGFSRAYIQGLVEEYIDPQYLVLD